MPVAIAVCFPAFFWHISTIVDAFFSGRMDIACPQVNVRFGSLADIGQWIAMSALLPKSDILILEINVRLVPIASILRGNGSVDRR